jgi:[protein-PII] uridylyltransferase
MPEQPSQSSQSLEVLLSEKASELISQKADGFKIAEELTNYTDSVVISCYQEGRVAQESGTTPELALLAVGGYGRREMMPYSDIDIMLLSGSDSPGIKDVVKPLLYGLWDRGLNISHSFRTLKGCVNDAMKDLHTRTAMMDCRFICGSKNIFDEFIRDLYQKLLYKNRRAFVSLVLAEIKRRHGDSGESLYLLEPNIKESKGGLRDIHSLSWLARTEFKMNNIADYASFLTDRQFRDFISAHNFLLRMRACVHISSARKNDILSADIHENVAALLEFRDTKRYFASEIMMRVFYQKSKVIADSLSKMTRLCAKRYFHLPISFSVKKISDHFYISKNEIIVKDPECLKKAPQILEAFKIYSLTGKSFSPIVEDLLKNSAFFIDRTGRSSREAIMHFREILRGARVYETLKIMHDSSVLDRFIPEFGRIRNLVILEAFHRYTVDEHTLIAIRNLENLRDPKDRKFIYLSNILKRLNQEVLCAAVLFHDIGKGVSRKHEETGYIIIGDILERLHFDKSERQMIEFLVRNHIVLSLFALTRDIAAPETIIRLAEIAGDETKLDALYIMTYADMRAVNPHFWNEWKASLLHELYTRTLGHLRGVIHDPYSLLGAEATDFARRMPTRYLLSSTAEEINRDYELAKLTAGDRITSLIVENGDVAELIVVSSDIAWIFPVAVGVLSKRGLNIVRARLFSGQGDLMVCKIIVSNWRELYWESMEANIREDLRNAAHLSGLDAYAPVFSHTRKQTAKKRGCLLEIDNETNEGQTMLEVTLPDYLGLLFEIAIRLYNNKIDILSSMINTDDGMAHDVFYLQKDGGRLNADDCMNILDTLLDIEPTE